MMKAISILVLLFASVAFADLRFYVAEKDAIRSAKADVQRFCVAVNEHPNSAYSAYAQFVFEQTTTAAIDWDFDGTADAYLKASSPIQTLALNGDASTAKWDQINFEKSGVFCGDVKSSHKLIKVILNINSVDGGSLTKVDGASAFPFFFCFASLAIKSSPNFHNCHSMIIEYSLMAFRVPHISR
jgi:hypothetical protein